MSCRVVCCVLYIVEYLLESNSFGNGSRAVVELFVKLASFTRSMLVKCLEDDVEVCEEEIQHARQTIASLRRETAPPFAAEEEEGASIDLDFLPPIMNLVDELEALEKQINESSRDSVGSVETDCSSVSGGTGDGSESVGGLERCEDSSHLPRSTSAPDTLMSTARVESKQLEVTHMIAMTEQCKQTISQLRKEVQRLESDKQSTAKQAKSSGISSAAVKGQSEKSIQLLKEKAKLLENKQKELRKKEIEYAKLMQQKEKAFKEVTSLTNELNSAKRIRVELVKKQKEEVRRW